MRSSLKWTLLYNTCFYKCEIKKTRNEQIIIDEILRTSENFEMKYSSRDISKKYQKAGVKNKNMNSWQLN